MFNAISEATATMPCACAPISGISRALTSAALGLQSEIVAEVLQDRHRAVLGVRAVLIKAPCRQ